MQICIKYGPQNATKLQAEAHLAFFLKKELQAQHVLIELARVEGVEGVGK